MKRILTITVCLLASALMLSGQNVPAKLWSGKTDIAHQPVTIKVAKSATDGAVAGTLTFKGITYKVYGDPRWQTADEYDLTLSKDEKEAGTFSGIIDDRGRILGTLKIGDFKECVHMNGSDTTMPDPFPKEEAKTE